MKVFQFKVRLPWKLNRFVVWTGVIFACMDFDYRKEKPIFVISADNHANQENTQMQKRARQDSAFIEVVCLRLPVINYRSV